MSKSAKKPVQKSKKTVKKTTKRPSRQKKPNFHDIVQAAILAGIIIAASAFISSVFIVVHSTAKAGKNPGNSAPEYFPAPDLPAQKPPEQSSEKLPAPKPTENIQAVEKPLTARPAVEKPMARPVQRPAQPVQRPELPQNLGTLVFIIDDAGNNLAELEPFLRFPGPLTIAVLPSLPHSAEAARRIRAAGKEVFLHQPMEALGGQAPGPGAIYAGMNEREIRDLLRRNAAEIGPVAGMNNHQGSKVSGDQKMMETVLEFCREQGMYFLDSRTTADTRAPAAAKSLGMKIGERNIFVDNDQDKSVINRYIKDGLGVARQQGSAVMIGHTWSPELAPLLKELYPSLVEQGYTFSAASRHIANAKN